jgi:oligopeptidase B
MYWEPTKMVAKLRAMKQDSNTILLYTSNAGHMGASGEDYYQEMALQYAFVLDKILPQGI